MEVAQTIMAYVRAHLQDPITAGDIARAVGYSQYHATRLFKAETGQSPFEYIRRERLLQSAHALRRGKPKVIDVALDFVFDSHEGFTRAFSNAFGITPKKYASLEKPEGWIIPYRYLDRQKTRSEETNMDEYTTVIFTQIVERPARKLVLQRSKNAVDSALGRARRGTRRLAGGAYAAGGIVMAKIESLCAYTPLSDFDFGIGDSVIVVIRQYDYSRQLIYGRILAKW